MITLEESTQSHFLTGAWHEAQRTFTLFSPSDGQALAEVADCGPEEARRAAEISTEAFVSWKQTTAFERAAVLERWYALILEHQGELARTMTREMGKPITEAYGEVNYAGSFVKWFAEEAKRLYGEILPNHVGNKRILAIQQPVGPVFAITPWNFPAAMITRKAAPALAAGCTVILKPAEQTPLSALHLAALWQEAGGPAGTLQVLPAANPVPLSDTLLADERIRKLTFTGSTEVGKLLYGKATATVKKVSLELGGHAPYLVFEDADLDHAVAEAMACKFRNAGQTCVCTNRIYVQASILETFSELYRLEVEKLVVGDPLVEATQVGPLANRQGLEKVEAHVKDALDKGARLVTGGQALQGLYFQPTILSDVTAEMRLMNEETFGPVAPLLSFDNEEEAIHLANTTPYGLAAYLYTNDLSRAFRVSEALEYGIVGVNDGVPSAPQAPFGGMKASGVGREGGKWGIREYVEVKYLSMKLR